MLQNFHLLFLNNWGMIEFPQKNETEKSKSPLILQNMLKNDNT